MPSATPENEQSAEPTVETMGEVEKEPILISDYTNIKSFTFEEDEIVNADEDINMELVLDNYDGISKVEVSFVNDSDEESVAELTYNEETNQYEGTVVLEEGNYNVSIDITKEDESVDEVTAGIVTSVVADDEIETNAAGLIPDTFKPYVYSYSPYYQVVKNNVISTAKKAVYGEQVDLYALVMDNADVAVNGNTFTFIKIDEPTVKYTVNAKADPLYAYKIDNTRQLSASFVVPKTVKYGVYKITLTAKDISGNTLTYDLYDNITLGTPVFKDTTKPSVVTSSYTPYYQVMRGGNVITDKKAVSGERVDMFAMVKDDIDVVATGNTFTFKKVGSSTVAYTAKATADPLYPYNVNNVKQVHASFTVPTTIAAGEYVITVNVKDAAGNTLSYDLYDTITLGKNDFKDTEKPYVDLSRYTPYYQVMNGGFVSTDKKAVSGDTVDLFAMIGDNVDVVEAGNTFTFTKIGSSTATYTAKATADSLQPYHMYNTRQLHATFTVPTNVASGEYIITVNAKDAAGNKLSYQLYDTITFEKNAYLDTVKPTVVIHKGSGYVRQEYPFFELNDSNNNLKANQDLAENTDTLYLYAKGQDASGINVSASYYYLQKVGTTQKLVAKTSNPGYSVDPELICGELYLENSIVDGTYKVFLHLVDNAGNFFDYQMYDSLIVKNNYDFSITADSLNVFAGDKSQINANVTSGVTYKSSNTTIATVTADGLVTFKNAGTVKITATWNGKTSSITYVSSKVTLDVSMANTSIPMGQTEPITITSNNPNVTDSAVYTSSNNNIAQVINTGSGYEVKGINKGTATITVKVGNVSKSVKVTVVPVQVADVKLDTDLSEGTVETDPNGSVDRIIIDWTDIAKGFTFHVTNSLADENGTTLATAVVWTTTDASVARVTSKNGVNTVTVYKPGQVTLTATAKDTNKVSNSIILIVRDFQPRLDTNAYTFNANKDVYLSLGLNESYGNAINNVTINDRKGNPSTYFETSGTTYKAISTTRNGSYPVQLEVETDKGTYVFNATIKVVRTLPATTVKFTGNYNVFTDTDNALTTIYDHKQETPTNYALDTNLALYWDINPTTGEITKNSTPFPNNKPVVSGKVTITYDDYNLPVVKGIKIPVVSTKPSYVLSRTSTTLYNQNSNTITLQLLDSKTKEVIDLSGMTITLGTKSIKGATITNDGTTITVTDTNMVSGNVIINVQDPSWITSINYTHKVVVSKTIAKASLSKTTLSLNSQVTGQTDSATVKLNQTNVELSSTGTLTAKKPSVETAKLSVVYSNGEISAKVTDPSIKAGTYPFVLPVFDDSGNALNTLTINVKVTTAMPKLTYTVKGNINPINRDAATVLTPKFTYVVDKLDDVTLDATSSAMFEATVLNNKVEIRAKDGAAINNGTYKVTVTTTGESGYVYTSLVTIRVLEVLPRLTIKNNRMIMYTSVDNANTELGTVTIIPSFGVIKDVEPIYNATLQKAFDYSYQETTLPELTISIKDPSKIKAGSTSTLKFKVTYVDQATNSTKYSYITVTVTDKTYKISGKKVD